MDKFFRLIGLLLLAGCNLGPDYEYPVVLAPDAWKNSSPETVNSVPCVALCEAPWWCVFDDELLNELEAQALATNPDLEGALWRVEEAWAMAGISRSDLFPHLDFAPVYGNSGSLIKLYTPPGNTLPNFPSTPYRIHQLLYSLPVNLNYELDLWGRLRKEAQAGRLSAESQQQAYRSALLSLTSQVASSYFNIKTLTALIQIYEETVVNRQKSLSLSRSRYEKGLTGALEISASEVELANNQANLSEALRQRESEINRLAALIGQKAPDFEIKLTPLDKTPPRIPPGVPSLILLNRPDLAEAERTREAEHARVGAAWASFFPSFTLTAGIGDLSPTTHDFMTWLSRYWGMNIKADQPLFDGGRRSSNFDAAWARFQQADAGYQSLVLTAFKEVEQALNDLHYEQQKGKEFLYAQQAASTSLSLASKRLQRGLVSLTEEIDYQRSLLAASLNVTTALGAEYQATLQLIKSLGGTWDCDCQK